MFRKIHGSRKNGPACICHYQLTVAGVVRQSAAKFQGVSTADYGSIPSGRILRPLFKSIVFVSLFAPVRAVAARSSPELKLIVLMPSAVLARRSALLIQGGSAAIAGTSAEEGQGAIVTLAQTCTCNSPANS